MRVEDRRVRLIFIPLFGIAIPNVAGLYGPITPSSLLYWVGTAYFVLISFLIWHGNRYFFFKQWQHPDWAEHPSRKVLLLILANILYTAPVTAVMLIGWYRIAGFDGPDWAVIRLVVLLCVTCVVFVTYTYEIAVRIHQRARDTMAVERLELAKAQAELAALRSQIDPHFLFNALNTLAGLIEDDPEKAISFNVTLADVYRYILRNRSRELVGLDEEIEFLMRYYSLLKLRFEDAIELSVSQEAVSGSYSIPAISTQVLLENAVKHNEFSPARPLKVELEMEDGSVVMRNRKRQRSDSRPAAGLGLRNLDERCRLILRRGIEVLEDEQEFAVRVPVAKALSPGASPRQKPAQAEISNQPEQGVRM